MGMQQWVSRRGVMASLAIVMMLPLLLGTLGAAPVAARQSDPPPTGPAPTVGDIVVDNYNCETGVIDFHVPVKDLRYVPEDTSGFDYPLAYNYHAYFEVGSDYFPSRPRVYSPTEAEAPYTGDVFLSLTVPTTNLSGVKPGTGAVTTIELYVGVGYGGYGYGAFDNATDSSVFTYTVDCNTPSDDIVSQLIALLIQILTAILAGQ